MKWRSSRVESRARYLDKFDTAEAARYDETVGRLAPEDEAAYLADIADVFVFRDGMRVLDAGAGTGTLCRMLAPAFELALTALEPAPAMLARIEGDLETSEVRAINGFCDSADDRAHFEQGEFDVIVSRQLANCFYDPLAAFSNWFHWLKPGGTVLLIDGLYPRAAWTGIWEEEIDALPLSACQTMATIPYLLEAAGFEVHGASLMARANERPSTMTTRYLTLATKPPRS